MRTAKQILDSLNMPYYIIPGNHDTKWSGSAGANFRRLWPDDQFVFDAGDYRFIGFHQGPILRMDDGHIPREDLDWLKKTLQMTGRDKPVILVMHYALTSSIDNWFECVEIIKDYNIKAIIHGHGHRSRLQSYQGIPGVMGRSTLRAGNDRGGFNIFELRNDSLFAAERITGDSTGQTWLKVDLSADYEVQSVPDSHMPDYSINQKYPKVKIDWLFESGYTTTASPVVSDNLVFIGDVSGKLRALSLENGEETWTFPAAGAIYATASVFKNYLVFNAADSFVYCIDKENQALLWKYPTNDAIVAVPVIYNNIVYTGASDGVFRAIDLNSGKLIWQNDNIKGYVETKPLIYQDKVIFGAWDGRMYALNLNHGSIAWIWQGDYTAPLYSPAAVWPVGAKGKVFFAAPDRVLSAVNSSSKNFKLVWAENFNYGYDIAPSMPMEKDGTLFWGTKNGLITAANAQNGEIIWQYKFENFLINTVRPINSNQLVFSNFDGKTGLIGLATK